MTNQPTNSKTPYNVVMEVGPEILTLIETRGEGGLFCVLHRQATSWCRGILRNYDRNRRERELLLSAACSSMNMCPNPFHRRLCRHPLMTAGRVMISISRGDVRAVLQRHGWTLAQGGENEYWRRPGKISGWSATLKDNVFYVFSSSAAPFEPSQAYSPFSVYAWLEHGGDFAAAASALRGLGYGKRSVARYRCGSLQNASTAAECDQRPKASGQKARSDS